MSLMDSLKAHVFPYNTARSAAHAAIENIAQQMDDAMRMLRQGDGGRALEELLAGLKRESGGIAAAIVKNTPADDSPQGNPAHEPKPNPVASTTVGGTVVNADMSRLADSGEAAFASTDGTVATFPQVDPATGLPAAPPPQDVTA